MLDTLKFDLLNKPCKSLLIAAKYALAIWGDDRPDWVEILANGNPDNWEAVIEAARADLAYEAGVRHPEAGVL